MEIIKRKILLEDSTDRTEGSETYGTLTATTFYLKIMITQDVDDMGLFTDVEFTKKDQSSLPPDYTVLINKLKANDFSFPFMLGVNSPHLNNFVGADEYTLRPTSKTESDYYIFGNLKIFGYTDSKIEDVRSYNQTNPFRVGFDVSKENYDNYKDLPVLGVDRIHSMGEPSIYVFDAENDSKLGTDEQTTGIQYKDYSGVTQTLINGEYMNIEPTTFSFIGEGINKTNTSLSALTKEEYLFGIISPPEVESDVFIERGSTSVMDLHLRLSEIGNISELTKYGNGFYKIKKQ